MAGAPIRSWMIRMLGLDVRPRDEVYELVASSANLRDGAYWLEILFSAGIATLGLTLNSPAVIIGAMLISPLMGPILANGLALASGDVVLAVRALASVTLSAILAVVFATILVILLPFREMTAEIAARTQPNTLDLVIALFSGAVGSIAVCKNVRGVATSIPGVAIAVALMPPLSVVGYGIGLVATVDRGQGLAVVRGGGLLFLTNLFAITFTSMVVFVLLRIDSSKMRESVRFPLPPALRSFGRLPVRLLLVGGFILSISFPLSRSFNELKQELTQHRFENLVRKEVTHVWEDSFARASSGSIRSYIDTFSANENGKRLLVQLRVFTSSPYSDEERKEFVTALAAAVHRPARSIELALVEIPTSRYEIASHKKPEVAVPPPPTFDQSLAAVAARVDAAVSSVTLPPPAVAIDHALIYHPAGVSVEVAYLSDHEISPDAAVLVGDAVRRATEASHAEVILTYVPATTTIAFGHRSTALSAEAAASLARVRDQLRRYPYLTAAVTAGAKDRNSDKRLAAVMAALGITAPDNRVIAIRGDPAENHVVISLLLPQS